MDHGFTLPHGGNGTNGSFAIGIVLGFPSASHLPDHLIKLERSAVNRRQRQILRDRLQGNKGGGVGLAVPYPSQKDIGIPPSFFEVPNILFSGYRHSPYLKTIIFIPFLRIYYSNSIAVLTASSTAVFSE